MEDYQPGRTNEYMKTLQEEWDHTTRHLEWLNLQFISPHQKNSKDWTDLEKHIANEYRQGAISTGEYRYWILDQARKQNIQIK